MADSADPSVQIGPTPQAAALTAHFTRSPPLLLRALVHTLAALLPEHAAGSADVRSAGARACGGGGLGPAKQQPMAKRSRVDPLDVPLGWVGGAPMPAEGRVMYTRCGGGLAQQVDGVADATASSVCVSVAWRARLGMCVDASALVVADGASLTCYVRPSLCRARR
jgi:hypothetical protein